MGVTGRGGAAGRALGDASGLDGGSTVRLGGDYVNGGTARGLDGTGRGLSGACGVGDTGVDGHSALELDGAGRVGPDATVGLGGGAAGLGGGATRLCDVGRADAGVRGLLVLLAQVVVAPGDLVILHVWLVAVQQGLVVLVESAAVYFVMPLMCLVALKLGLMVLAVVKPVLADVAKILTSGKCDIVKQMNHSF
ncbi:hypothetical protein F443_21498, partial [Phytophthora nicotianae P1569]